MSYSESIAANVRAEASRRNVKSHELAELLGFSETSLRKRLNGLIEFRPSEIEKISIYMEVPIEELTRHVVGGVA
ncbi:helix-turn-helix domain-containing protein [Rothia sp. P4278]|uniref:helix-turn-helix domain-containing protein n=1 Tax=Rothia sp. P4278 TaxID=3402658 RepID=UPI003AEB3CCC